ncbi:MAG TPA: OPT/YSL family transporter [Anaeromyxobacteraceae bacterium]|nr:OPT/YSL family transporter [Anaeromyxobacteraceae bacterium]
MSAPAPDRPDAPRPELSGRALATGLSVGVLLAVGNLYMGLKTGWWDTGHVTATLLGAGLAAAASRRGGPLGEREHNVVQTAATSVGAAPATFGLLGAVPALALLGIAPPLWAVVALGLSAAVLGILWALALRRRLLEEEGLPFPTGVATAQVIRALHAGTGAATRAGVLAVAGAAAAAVTLLRDVWRAIPAAAALPGTLAGAPASAYTLGIGWSPMLFGAGMVVGPRNGLSVLLGGIVAWAALGPALVRSGAVPAPEYGALVAWLAWPGVGLVLGGALVSIVRQRRAFLGALRDLRQARRSAGPRARGAVALGLSAAALALAACTLGVGLGPGRSALALGLALLLAAVSVRAAGQTDILPAGEMAQVVQVSLGAGPDPGANVAGGALAAGQSAQAGVSLWSLRAGQILGASPGIQARAMLAGALLGGAVSLPAYAFLVRAHGIGTAALPAPMAVPWKAVAELVTGGGAGLPPGALAAAAIAFAAGVALEALGGRIRFLPTPGALGMGFIAPARFAAALCAGALLGAAWRRRWPASAEALGPAAAAGAIAGESIAGAAAAAVAVAGLVGP